MENTVIDFEKRRSLLGFHVDDSEMFYMKTLYRILIKVVNAYSKYPIEVKEEDFLSFLLSSRLAYFLKSLNFKGSFFDYVLSKDDTYLQFVKQVILMFFIETLGRNFVRKMVFSWKLTDLQKYEHIILLRKDVKMNNYKFIHLGKDQNNVWIEQTEENSYEEVLISRNDKFIGIYVRDVYGQ